MYQIRYHIAYTIPRSQTKIIDTNKNSGLEDIIYLYVLIQNFKYLDGLCHLCN